MRDRYSLQGDHQFFQVDSSASRLHIPNLVSYPRKDSFSKNNHLRRLDSPLGRLIPNLKSEKLLLAEYSGNRERLLPDGSIHTTHWWVDETGHHRESYNLTPDGDIVEYHYGQRFKDSSIVYEFWTDDWKGDIPYDGEGKDPSSLCVDCGE